MKKIKLNIAYIGTAYCGWQVQPNAVTVQEKLQDAVEKVFGKRYPITGCSRTDSGVHAKDFVCTAELDEEANSIPTERVPIVMNRVLPLDISVKKASEVLADFHPRYSSVGKEYEYIYYDNNIRDPFLHGRVAHVFPRLDEKAMNDAAAVIVGRQDFAAFMAKGSKITDTVRTVYDCSVRREGDCVILRISADGFLYNMVRIIAGTLADAGHHKLTKEQLKEIILSKDRSRAGQTLAPEGLCLARVFYNEDNDNEKK